MCARDTSVAAARWAVAQEPHGLCRVGLGSGAGSCAFSHPRPRPFLVSLLVESILPRMALSTPLRGDPGIEVHRSRQSASNIPTTFRIARFHSRSIMALTSSLSSPFSENHARFMLDM